MARRAAKLAIIPPLEAVTAAQHAMGWLPDYPDIRDYTPESTKVGERHEALGATKSIRGMLAQLKVAEPLGERKLKTAAPDLQPWFSPIEDQGKLGSCTANAGAALIEYFERRAFGRYIDASRLFLYKATRTMLHQTGDTGAFLRTTMGAMALFGLPPEEYWPYDIAKYDLEPTGFCYAFAQNYQAMSYYRLDPPGTPRPDLLQRIKTNLVAGLPSMFGFSVYQSYAQAATTGKLPFPRGNESVVGGHAVVACGYDDDMEIRNNSAGGPTTKGALKIRNSWGTGWGEEGYGWLPYEYVIRGLAQDFWSALRFEWVDSKQFGV